MLAKVMKLREEKREMGDKVGEIGGLVGEIERVMGVDGADEGEEEGTGMERIRDKLRRNVLEEVRKRMGREMKDDGC